MRRKKKSLPDRVRSLHRHFGMFSWQECAECGEEFRREWGWVFEKAYPVNRRINEGYLCPVCAPGRSWALDLAGKHAQLPPRPAPPCGHGGLSHEA